MGPVERPFLAHSGHCRRIMDHRPRPTARRRIAILHAAREINVIAHAHVVGVLCLAGCLRCASASTSVSTTGPKSQPRDDHLTGRARLSHIDCVLFGVDRRVDQFVRRGAVQIEAILKDTKLLTLFA